MIGSDDVEAVHVFDQLLLRLRRIIDHALGKLPDLRGVGLVNGELPELDFRDIPFRSLDQKSWSGCCSVFGPDCAMAGAAAASAITSAVPKIAFVVYDDVAASLTLPTRRKSVALRQSRRHAQVGPA